MQQAIVILQETSGASWGSESERYSDTPNRPIEVDHVYTVEPGLFVPGYNYMGLEGNAVVTETGTMFW